MKIQINRSILKMILFIGFAALQIESFAQEIQSNYKTSTGYKSFNIKSASFLLPIAHPAWHYDQSISFSYVDIPPAWTLDRINAPMLSYNAKFSLPYGLNVQGSLSTMIVSNRLNFGPFWNFSIHNYHFGIGYQFAYDMGFLNRSGYDTKFSGWEQQPSITAGYSFKKFAIILRGDYYWTKSINLNEGGHSIHLWNGMSNGYSISASIEQRLYKNKVVSMGIKVNNIRYHFVAWPAFPVNQYRYIVPEFTIGINL